MGAADTRLEFDSAIPPPNIRAFSSAGRAPDLHSGGQEFDPPKVHQKNLKVIRLTMIYIKRLNTCFIRIPKNASSSVVWFLYNNVCTEEDTFSRISKVFGIGKSVNGPDLANSHADATYLINNDIVPASASFLGVIREPLERQLSLYLFRIRDGNYGLQKPSPEHFRSLLINGILPDSPQQMQSQSSFIPSNLKRTFWLCDRLDYHLQDFCLEHNIITEKPLQILNKSPGNTKKLVNVFYNAYTKKQVEHTYYDDFQLYYSLVDYYK